MANKDLLKQAIAEAKSVREAAIANAKEALEETLTPHLKDLLAAKLQESEEVEEGSYKEEMDETVEEMNHEDEDMAMEEAEDDSVESDDEVEPEEEMEDLPEEEDEEIGDLSVEEFKDMIRDIIAQELGGAEADMEDMDAGDIEGMGDEESMEDPMMDQPEEDEEEIDLDELLAELDSMSSEEVEKGKMKEERSTPEFNNLGMSYDEFNSLEDVTAEYLAANQIDVDVQDEHGGYELVDLLNPKHVAKFDTGEDMGAEYDDIYDLGDGHLLSVEDYAGYGRIVKAPKNEGMKKNHNMDEEVVNEDLDPSILAAISSLLVPAGAVGLTKLMDYLKDKHPKVAQGLEKLGASSMGRDVSDMDKDLNEALSTIKTLKRDLQEVNLLNSKLLYVNKVFKSNDLSESQKVNVIAAFDKAETVKEAKLVFETVSENVGRVKSKNVTESKIKGMASKATGTTASRPEVITEVSDTVRRMQKLAGIIK